MAGPLSWFRTSTRTPPVRGESLSLPTTDDFSQVMTASKSMVQSVFSIPALDQPSTCNVCGMTYQRSSEKDGTQHKKYHYTFVHGPLFDMREVTPLSSSRITVDKKSFECRIFVVHKDSPKMVRKAEVILAMVNQELNAPRENLAWKSRNNEAIEGKAFIIIINRRAVALCATEAITDVEKQTRWMVHRTQEVVPRQIIRNAKIGISRIWVATSWRRKGLGMMLLDTVMRHSVYGMVLSKREIAFSQPSYSGGLLAKRFCGIKHKSGEILVPIYLEKT